MSVQCRQIILQKRHRGHGTARLLGRVALWVAAMNHSRFEELQRRSPHVWSNTTALFRITIVA